MIEHMPKHGRTRTVHSVSEALDRAALIADQVEPRYRTLGRSYACTGTVGKLWSAAYEGARIALENRHP